MSSSFSGKLLMFAAAVSLGYIVTSIVMSRLSPEDALQEENITVIDEAPGDPVEQYTAGVDLPPEVLSRMRGDPPQPPRETTPATTNYNFLITKHGREQIEDFKAFYSSPEGQKQEDGVTISNLDEMARDGRMIW